LLFKVNPPKARYDLQKLFSTPERIIVLIRHLLVQLGEEFQKSREKTQSREEITEKARDVCKKEGIELWNLQRINRERTRTGLSKIRV